MQPQFELSPEPLSKSGLGRLARYGIHQKTISWGGGGKAERKYLLSDPRLEWLAKGPLFKPACFHQFQIAHRER